MAKVVSIINLKGGVGKTTITVALAEFLVVEHKLNVLVIDLDPQTNSTVAMIGEGEWERRNQQGQTLYHLFKDKLNDSARFDIEQAIVQTTSNLQGGLKHLHLLPSSLDFVQIQDRLINIGQIAMIRPFEVLKRALGSKVDQYDVVLIDCPPNLGIVTQNGLMMSDWYLIPAIPDHLSTYGIPQIVESVNNFNRKTDSHVEALGIVASMFRANVTRHASTLAQLQAKADQGHLPRLFKSKIPLASKMSDASDFKANVNTIRQKYGVSGTGSYEAFHELAKEFKAYVGL